MQKQIPNKLKTHCPLGHEYNAENTAYQRKEYGGFSRLCKICRKITNDRNHAKYTERKRKVDNK